MNRSSLPVGFVLALMISAGALAQRTWVVDACPLATSRDFADLPSAVASAAPGDTLLVVGNMACPTAYYYQAAHIDKPICVVGLVSGGNANPNLEPRSVTVIGRITVSGIPEGQRVILANIGLGPDAGVNGSGPYGLHVWDCAGEVVLEDIYSFGGWANFRFRLDRCQDVVMHWCDIAPGSESMAINDSQVRMVSSRIRATNGFTQNWPGVFWYGTTEAIHMRNSDVLLSADCLVEGGDGTGSSGGAAAVLLESGTLRAGPGVQLWGGYEGSQNPPQTRYAAGVQHHPPGTGQAFADPRAYVNRFTPQPATIHAVYHQPVIQNQTQQVFLSGPPGGFGLLAVGNAPITPWPMLQYGTLGIDPWTLQFVAAVPLPSTHGTATLTLFTSNQVPIGFPFAWQGAVIAPDGAISLTEPSTFTVAWAHGRVL